MKTTIGTGVIGIGILGSRHARVYQEQDATKLVALADSNAQKAEESGKKFGVKSFADYRTMLRTLGPNGSGELRAVSVATPDFAHYEVVHACLTEGLDVFVEKPLTIDVGEANALIETAEKQSRVLMVNYSQRFLPEHLRVAELMSTQALGPIAFIESHRWDAAWVPLKMIPWAPKTTPIHFMSSHDIDLILHWTGERVETVQAMVHSGILAGKTGEKDLIDGIVALLRLQSGIVISLHSSWILPAGFPLAADTYLEVLGIDGSLFLSGSTREFRLYRHDVSEKLNYGGPATATEVQGKIEGAFTKSLSTFVDSVRDRILNGSLSARKTLHVVEVQDAIVRAAKTGSIIRMKG